MFGAPDAEFWEAYWRGDHECLPRARGAHRPAVSEALAARRLGRQYGAYQSQLKAIMKMIGQPGGEVRRPRLPVSRSREPRGDQAGPASRSRCCPRRSEAA